MEQCGIDREVTPLAYDMFNRARILVAPLDWGLGHASRCIPIIRRLQELDAIPIIGADAGPMVMLRDEFPDLEHVVIPGMEVTYSKGSDQRWSMMRQFPAMVRSVHKEKAHFGRMLPSLQLDAVISDQRFGIRSSDLPSVVITHQVFPFTPFVRKALCRLNHHQLARFDRCWIMDDQNFPGLAGELSHGNAPSLNVRYIGTHSRLRPAEIAAPGSFRIVAVISGPEPQRTLLEELLCGEMQGISGDHLLVRGTPGHMGTERIGNVTLIPYLGSEELVERLCAAELIVSRCGYTTLMDLVALGRTALLIPTPGQLEQEYLGTLHKRTGRFIIQDQDGMELQAALDLVQRVSVPNTRANEAMLDAALKDLAGLLR